MGIFIQGLVVRCGTHPWAGVRRLKKLREFCFGVTSTAIQKDDKGKIIVCPGYANLTIEKGYDCRTRVV